VRCCVAQPASPWCIFIKGSFNESAIKERVFIPIQRKQQPRVNQEFLKKRRGEGSSEGRWWVWI
jgi:hypothetical protein